MADYETSSTRTIEDEISRQTFGVLDAVRLSKGRKCLVWYLGADVSAGRETGRMEWGQQGLDHQGLELGLAHLMDGIRTQLLARFGAQLSLEIEGSPPLAP